MSAQYCRYGDNLARAKTVTVDAGTEDTDYPKANLVDGDPAVVAKLTGTTGRYRIDLGSSLAADVVCLINHNLDAALANVTICGNDDGVFANPMTVAAKTIVIPSDRANGMTTNAVLDISSDTATARYWFLSFASANSAAIAIGELWLGATLYTLKAKYPATEGSQEHLVEHVSPAGVEFRYRQDVEQWWQVFTVHFPGATLHTQGVNLIDAAGTTYSWLYWPDSATNAAYLVRFRERPQVQQTAPTFWIAEFSVREVSPGLL